MLNKHYKLVCWLIWLIGYSVIFITLFLYHRESVLWDYPKKILFVTLFSSISFAALAIYTKKVFENKRLDFYRRNARFSGIIGAFSLTVLLAIGCFSASMESAFNPVGMFWMASFTMMYLGALIGMGVHAIVMKNRNNKV